MPVILANERNIDPNLPQYAALLAGLQGNILKGHGRERSAHIFLTFQGGPGVIAAGLTALAPTVTTMKRQLTETQQFKDFQVPGGLFVTIALSASGYRKLGLPQPSEDLCFGQGMLQAGPSLGDPPAAQLDAKYQTGGIDAVLMLADDDEDFLLRAVRTQIDDFDQATPPWATVATVEIGRALRNEAGEGIEHFGFVDGRSQPLYLLSDVCDEIDTRTGANINNYNPSEPLSRVLVPDPLVSNLVPPVTDACGSLMVFRKLEQNVQGFRMKEQELATKMGLVGPDRARAGAMVVGRFQDGTPLSLSQVDGLIPSKDNNFNFMGDPQGQKCPFQAHIRKVNPRGDLGGLDSETERAHRITRRGIAYDDRLQSPSSTETLEELPSIKVGLLFVCFQASIDNQFAFMQRSWANFVDFAHTATGIDPVIGQVAGQGPIPDQTWQPSYGGPPAPPPPGLACPTAPVPAPGPVGMGFHGFVKMLGGEFFFAPSVNFLNNLVAIIANPPPGTPFRPPLPVQPGPPYGGQPMPGAFH